MFRRRRLRFPYGVLRDGISQRGAFINALALAALALWFVSLYLILYMFDFQRELRHYNQAILNLKFLSTPMKVGI